MIAQHGPTLVEDGVRFRVWAPDHARVELVLDTGAVDMAPCGDGFFEHLAIGLGAGARYRYRLDGAGPFPDPASRSQPEGPHGPSEVVDARFGWQAPAVGLDRTTLVIYELHVGTFTREGTFAACAERLDELVDLGITAIELMPVADFPGGRGWGYDGVSLFAPKRAYGTPDELRRLVDAAHLRGLGVILDVVYNHLGPDGNYLGCYARDYFTDRHPTPWGDGLAFDGPRAGPVRALFLENVAMWIADYRFDGLRLDATHAIVDDSPYHILQAIGERARQAAGGSRRVVVIAEDDRNERQLILPTAQGGFGLDGQWADDLHHSLRVALAGDRDGYYVDYEGTPDEIARALERGWLYEGQLSQYRGGPRGTPSHGIAPEQLVVCLDNHDQIGNRAFGERLHLPAAPDAYRAATALLLLGPATPLIFMGQEFLARSPFLYFTDHHAELGQLVTCGRRREFARFEAFSSEALRERIPDPQALATYRASVLHHEDRHRPEGAAHLALVRELLSLRLGAAQLRGSRLGRYRAHAAGQGSVVLAYRGLVVVARLSGDGPEQVELPAGRWSIRLDTESFVNGGQVARLDGNRLLRTARGATILVE